MIFLNLKTYAESVERYSGFVNIARNVASETGVRIVVCPPMTLLADSVKLFDDIYSQHVDSYLPGAHTGSITAQMLKSAGIKGSLLNHSEKRMPVGEIKLAIEQLHTASLESLVCVANATEAGKFADLNPYPQMIAVEPPELIGSGVSVSTAKPEVIVASANAIRKANPNGKIKFLCGAGIGNPQDMKRALELGADGILLASAYVKAKNPNEFLNGLARMF